MFLVRFQVEPYSRTGLCQKQHRNLLAALERAYDLGHIPYEVPFRKYEYSDYYPQLSESIGKD